MSLVVGTPKMSLVLKIFLEVSYFLFDPSYILFNLQKL